MATCGVQLDEEPREPNFRDSEDGATSDAGKTGFPRSKDTDSLIDNKIQFRLPSTDSGMDTMPMHSYVQESEVEDLRLRIAALERMLDAMHTPVRGRAQEIAEDVEDVPVMRSGGAANRDVPLGLPQSAGQLLMYHTTDPSGRLVTPDQDIGKMPSETTKGLPMGYGAGGFVCNSTVRLDSQDLVNLGFPSGTLHNHLANREYGTKTRTKNKKPAFYDGNSNWGDYLVQFGLISEMNQWDERSKAMELATALRGTAQGILSDLTVNQRKDYTSLTTALTARFQPDNQEGLYKAQIKGKLRKKDETLPELAQGIKRIVRLGYPSANEEIRQQLTIDCFIDALNDSEMEWAVHSNKACTIEDAVSVALAHEAFQIGRRKHITSNIRQMDTENDSFIEGIMERIAAVQLRNEQTHADRQNSRNSRTTKSLECFYCRQPGHMRRNCENRLRDKRYRQSQPKLRLIHEEDSDETVHASDRQKRTYDHRGNAKQYKVDEAVWIRVPTRTKGCSSKLQDRWDGPWLIEGQMSDLVYMIRKSRSTKRNVVHHDLMKPYHGFSGGKSNKQQVVGQPVEKEIADIPIKASVSEPGHKKRIRRSPKWMGDFVV